MELNRVKGQSYLLCLFLIFDNLVSHFRVSVLHDAVIDYRVGEL
jgi:hypothetical protein